MGKAADVTPVEHDVTPVEHKDTGWKSLDAVWENVRALAYGFRIAWVSTTSVVAGLVLFLLPQAQDLFLEARGDLVTGVGFWATFYALVLLVWVLPVYVSARWILWQCRRGSVPHPDVRPAPDWVRRLVPPLLAVGCLLSICAGQLWSIHNVPNLGDLAAAEQQLDKAVAQGKAACGTSGAERTFSCLLSLPALINQSLIWVFRSEWDLGPEWIALVFYVFCGLLIAWIFAHSESRLLTGEWRLAATIAWWVVTLIVLPIVLVVVGTFLSFLWDEANRPFSLAFVAYLPGASLLTAHVVWQLARPRHGRTATWLARLVLLRFGSTFSDARAITWIVNPVFFKLCILAVAATAALLVLSPLDLTKYISRAHIIPFILGPLVPPATYLSLWSSRIQAPLVVAFVLLMATVRMFVGDEHDVRIQAASGPRPTLDEAVAQWASANGCKITIPARAGNEPDCPSPIIVAAAGGASRAGFFVGAVIGKLMDERQGTDGRNFRPFDKQLFAISGVSGGSVGAVMTYAALADGKRQQVEVGSERESRSTPPCVDSRASVDRQWFMTESGELGPANQPSVSWKSCLELMLSGDFLSPVFASLLGTDLLGIGHDRAVTLEQAWERRYSDMTGRDTLAETMSSVRSRATAQHVWLPILLLNGTSVETGRRIITSDIQTSRVAPQSPQHETSETSDNAVFRDFYDLNELLGSSSRSEEQNTAFGYERKLSVLRPSEKDVALSTAGTMSARFPFISPHGTIRGRDHQFVDHVVDGGYFENFGATTALELAQVLYNRYRLTPTLMLVDNEPSTSAMECVFPEGEEKSIPKANSINLFADVSSTLHAMLETRTARATLAAVELCGFAKDTKGTFAYIRVRLESEKPLSMSWWLSKHVQKYLDLQLVDSLNAHAFDLIRERRLATGAKREAQSD